MTMTPRVAAILAALVLAPVLLQAQAPARGEVYVGYPFLMGENASPLFGVHGAIGARSRTGIGIAGEAVLHFGEAFADKSLWTFLVGPTFLSKGKVRGLVQVKVGTAVSGCGEFVNGCRTKASFAGAFGGGVDFNPRGGVSYRAQVDRLFTNFGGTGQQFTRVSLGAVFPLH